MSTETQPHTPPSGRPQEAAQPDAADAFQSPDELMQAATERIASLEASTQDYKDRWMRSEAEMSNVRQRAKREVDETRQYAVQKFARDVVEVAENLRRGLDSLPPQSPGETEALTKLRDGFGGIERSFIATLERHGVRREDPTGALFDPNLHQAMAEQESADHPPGTVLNAWTAGWTLNGRLLRPAMVVVAKTVPPESGGHSHKPMDPVGPADAVKLDTTA